MSADSSDNYFEEDTEDKDDDPIERISIGSSGHGTLEIKLEKVEGDHGIEKTDIESDDDVMIIEIDTDKKTNPKDSVDKENQENVPRKDCEDKSVKDQIGKCLAEQKKVMHLSSSLNAKGSNPTLVPSKQSNASKPLIKKSNTVERGYLQDMSRQEALKTSVSLLNKPLDMALLGKKRESKSKSPIRASISSNTKLKDDKKNKNDIDEGTSDLTSVKVKTEAPWSVKAGEIDLRFTDSGRIRFDSGKCFYSEDEKKVILRYAHKHSVDAASKKYLVPMATVKYWIKHNIAMDGNKQKYSEEQRTRILSFASKYGLVAAASNFNVPFNTIKFWHWSNDKKKSIEEKVKCKKSRSKYTEEERARITQYAIENGKVAACRRYKVPFGTVSVWVSFKKEKDKSRAKGPAMLKRPGPVPRKKMKKRYGIGTEKKIVEWIKEKHKKKEHISGKMVRSYCLSLVKDELPKFKATIGWLNTFLTRNNLKNHVSDIFKDSEQAVKGTHKTSEEVSLDKDSLPSEGNKASEVKDVKKGKKRRKFTEVQKASILRYATVRSVRAACLFYKVQPCQLYAWRATKALTKDSKVTGKLNTGPKSGEASNKDTSHNDAGTDNADNLSIGTESSESDLVEREEENNMSEPDNTQDDDINSNDMSSHDNVETTRVDDPMIEPNPNPKLIKRKGNHKGRTVAYGEKIDFEIFWWIIQQGKQGKEVSGNMIRAHALSVVKQKRPDLDFKASDSWMKSFLRRHSLELHFEKDDL